MPARPISGHWNGVATMPWSPDSRLSESRGPESRVPESGVRVQHCGLWLTLLWLLMLAWPAVVLAADASSDPLFLVELTTGPAWDEQLEAGQQSGFAEHSANMQQWRADGRIQLGARAGERGVLLMQAPDAATLSRWLDADPGVERGLFVYRLTAMSVFYPWPAESGSGDSGHTP